jgi:hypothetical protein
VDDRHDELRAIEALFAQMEDQVPDDRGRVMLVGDTDAMLDVLNDGVRQALERLDDAHDGYRGSRTGAALRPQLELGAGGSCELWDELT